MKLYEYKAKVVATLLNYRPKDGRERELRERLLVKASTLRGMWLASFLLDIHLIINHEPVSEEFKEVLGKLIPKPEEVEEMVGEG